MSQHSSGLGLFGRKRNDPRTWDPYEGEEQQQHPIHMGPSKPTQRPSPILNMECKETSDSYVYTAHLPGYNPNDVHVKLDDDRMLSITCGKTLQNAQQRHWWRRLQRSSGRYVQRLTLPHNSNARLFKTFLDSGVLTITVPKHNTGLTNTTNSHSSSQFHQTRTRRTTLHSPP
ncbi:hypothetical protein VNO78_15727 [Psophocarpus tetragonolobus]|uniref:SHSP domain-containing protein n=1 Tax=Psophocarpus tetragonolobus TaxID=3891 RepID=A0AAN9SFH2_PSOTE